MAVRYRDSPFIIELHGVHTRRIDRVHSRPRAFTAFKRIVLLIAETLNHEPSRPYSVTHKRRSSAVVVVVVVVVEAGA